EEHDPHPAGRPSGQAEQAADSLCRRTRTRQPPPQTRLGGPSWPPVNAGREPWAPDVGTASKSTSGDPAACCTWPFGLRNAASTPVVELSPDRMGPYVTARRAGEISGRPVGATVVHQEVKLLKSMMKWATGVFEQGRPLLDRNPLTGFAVPKTRDPRRPMIDADTVEKLLTVADRVSPLLPLLIMLMESTGRRLSSVLGLRWDDFDFQKRTITWRAELDKKRKTWVVPMPTKAEQALLAFRAAHPAIGSALVFPMKHDPMKPISRHHASVWLERAYRRAGLQRQRQGLWHPFRRKWATDRKSYPVRDVAAAGGWDDLPTAMMYQHADQDTLREVMDNPKQPQKRSQQG